MLASVALQAATIKHEFLAIDEGLANLLHVDENNPAGHLLGRQSTLHGLSHLPFGRDAARSEHHRGRDLLSQHRMGQPEAQCL